MNYSLQMNKTNIIGPLPVAQPGKPMQPSAHSATSRMKWAVALRMPKPLPLGEVSPKVTERASPWRQKRRHSDKQALCQSDEIAVRSLCCEHPCPLRRFAPALPKGEPFGYTSTTFYHTFPPATRLNGRKTAKTGRKVEKMRDNHSAAAPRAKKHWGKNARISKNTITAWM